MRIARTSSTVLSFLLGAIAACSSGAGDPGESAALRADPVSGQPWLERFPVFGPSNIGWEPGLDAWGPWVCDGSLANSDFYLGGTNSHPTGHLGNDVFAHKGTTVVVARSGVVTFAGWDSLGGNAVVITDESGWSYYYAHMDGFDGAVHKGSWLPAGQRIGGVSNTGGASGTAPHLHFSIYPNGNYDAGIDPFPYLAPVAGGACNDPNAAPPEQPPADPPPADPPPADPTSTDLSCGDWAAQKGWSEAFCEWNDNDACGGVGIATWDCAHCCKPPSCGELAQAKGWSVGYCEWNGNGACGGQGTTTWDCDHCCGE